MNKIKEWAKKEWADTKLLFRSVPAITMSLFAVSIVIMNLLANKLIVNESWIALDAGILVSWLAFLTMDMLVKRFGPKASTKIVIAVSLINLLVVAIFNIAAVIPGMWGEGGDAELNATIAGSWQVLLASTVAFIAAGFVNNFMNWAILGRFKNRTKFSVYAVSSYVSTALAQFIDNFIFAMLFTFMNGWITFTAAVMFAAVGAVVELICEIVFSPLGYRISEKWRKEGVGSEYLGETKEGFWKEMTEEEMEKLFLSFKERRWK